jgi:hypothetical protein
MTLPVAAITVHIFVEHTGTAPMLVANVRAIRISKDISGQL